MSKEQAHALLIDTNFLMHIKQDNPFLKCKYVYIKSLMTKEIWFATETTKFYAPYNRWYSILFLSRWYNRLIHSLTLQQSRRATSRTQGKNRAIYIYYIYIFQIYIYIWKIPTVYQNCWKEIEINKSPSQSSCLSIIVELWLM